MTGVQTCALPILDELETATGHYYHRFAFGGDAQILFGNRPDYRIEPDLMFRGMIDRLAAENTD